jgi:hypothetical protein
MFQQGDLVRWYDLYGDVGIVKDTGLGIIIQIMKYEYFKKPTYIYKVHRVRFAYKMNFEENQIELHKEIKNEIK